MKPHPYAMILLLAAFLLSACGSGQLFGPTVTPTATITSTPTSTPVPTVTPTRTPRPTPVSYDGEWAGTTSAGGRITFIVENYGILWIKMNFGLSTKRSSCNVDVKISTVAPGFRMSVNTFSIEGFNTMIKGAFDSATTASGTVEATADSPHCQGGVNLTWTAEKQP